ncbi:MAG: hypothetical protein AAGI68_07600 [Planctomycetota bacterium]
MGIWDFAKLLFDFPKLSSFGLDVPFYAGMALLGTSLFLLRLVLSLMLGIGGDVDFDVDLEDHGAGFGVFSILSITAFLMGAGWMGLLCRLGWELSPGPSAAVSGGTGIGFMLLAAAGLFLLAKLGHEVKADKATAVGRTGQVYMALPAKGEGQGKVRVSISGRSMISEAVSTGEAIESFAAVKVESVRDDGVLLVSRV